MKKIESGELKDFFKKLLEIPSEFIKEFIFDKKKYVKYNTDDLYTSKILGSMSCWSVEEWDGKGWQTTDKVIISHSRMMKYNDGWLYEADMSDVPESPVVLNNSGTFLVDLE